MSRRRRRPSPMTALYAPPEWREHASLDGRPLDLVRAFSWRPVRDLVRIEIALPDGSRFYPYRDADDFARMKYHAGGEGTMSRGELRDAGTTDAKLEREIVRRFGVRLRLAGGRDTPRKRCLRFEAYRLLLDALTSSP